MQDKERNRRDVNTEERGDRMHNNKPPSGTCQDRYTPLDLELLLIDRSTGLPPWHEFNTPCTPIKSHRINLRADSSEAHPF
jgi:hypothetical protein